MNTEYEQTDAEIKVFLLWQDLSD